MKQFTLFILVLLSSFGQHLESKTLEDKAAAQVVITNHTGKHYYFQLKGISIRDRIEYDASETTRTLHIDLEAPAYYEYTDGKQKNYTVYLTPGSKTEITETADGVSIQGDHAAINKFINENSFLGHGKKNVAMYSAEWQQESRKEMEELCNKVSSQAGFPADFVKMQKLYYQFAYYTQQLEAPLIAAFVKIKLNLPENYYDFLKTMRFDSPFILSIPKWFDTMVNAFGEMEKRGMMPVDKERFMQLYAGKIENEKLRSAFLVQLLERTLKRGYSDDFPAYVESVRSAITGEKDQATLKELEAKYATLKEANKEIARGMPAPDFTAVDVNGKEYKLSDFAGKVIVLDFWFTGCVPCKMEMPYMENIAESMKNAPIQFISMSLDYGKQLLPAWKEMVKDQKGPVLNLNVPGGFKSSVAEKLGIRSVPRIVIIDAQGKIYDSNALRPSDPKLKQTLEALLGISTPKQEIRNMMMTMMKAETAEQKDAILKKAISKFGRVQEVGAMLNMMIFQVIDSYAKEKKYEQADNYISKVAPSTYRRDLVFITGTRYAEDGALDRAAVYLKEAAETTLQAQKEHPEDAEENDKLPVICAAYGNLLVTQGKLAEAEKWVELAYGNGEKADFDLKKSYIAIQINKKEYSKAFPVLEDIFRNAMGTEAMKTMLKEAYVHKNGSAKGFDKYMEGLQTEATNKQKEEILSRIISEPAPDFTLKNMEGKEVSLSALKGKVVILDFWATWCGPCKSSFPAMHKAVRKYKNNKNVAFLFIDTWESAKNPLPKVKQFIEEHKYDFNVLFDLKDPVSKKCEVIESYGAKGIPAKYIIDKEGNIRFKLVGFSGSDEQAVSEISEMIDILL